MKKINKYEHEHEINIQIHMYNYCSFLIIKQIKKIIKKTIVNYFVYYTHYASCVQISLKKRLHRFYIIISNILDSKRSDINKTFFVNETVFCV